MSKWFGVGVWLCVFLAACGSGSENEPCGFGACDVVENRQGSGGGTLCFEYFQRCVNPQVMVATFGALNCSNSGCHRNGESAGKSLKLFPAPAIIPLADPTNPTASELEAVYASQMYSNFVTTKGNVDFQSIRQSYLIKKPLLELSHGGGQVFSESSTAAQQLLYWMNNTVPEGQNEFAATCASLFVGGLCKSTFP
jgi:hypothetical protein